MWKDWAKTIPILLGGFVLVIIGAHFTVESASTIAKSFGISEWIIGIIMISLGTSLPELVVSISAAVKGKVDMAIGNIIGSNMYNLLAVLAIPGLLAPGPFDPLALTRDMPVMIGLTLALFVMGYGFGGKGRINRIEAALLVAVFIGFHITILLLSATVLSPVIRLPAVVAGLMSHNQTRLLLTVLSRVTQLK